MQGGHNPYIPFEWYLDLLGTSRRYHPIHIHGFSPSEVDFFAKTFRMDARDVIRELMKAGLDSIPGGGGEILVQRVRDQVAKKKAGADRWLEIMEIAHSEGMKTSVTMMYGIGETLAERIEHLERVREVQARTNGFTAFICWPLQPENTPTMSHMQKTDADRLSAHRRHRAHRARQRAEPPGELGDDGHEGRPDRAALRLQRFRLAHDRGERRLGREHHAPHDDRRDRAPDPRRRLHGRAPPAGLLDPARLDGQPARPRDARDAPRVRTIARRHRLRLAPLRAAGAARSSAAFPFRATCISRATPTATPSRTRSPTRSSAPRRRATSARCSPIAIRRTRARIRSRCCAPPSRASRTLGWRVQQVDVAIVAEQPKIASHRELMRARLAPALGVDADDVSVKGKTNEGMGWIGRGEGIACIAVATLVPSTS